MCMYIRAARRPAAEPTAHARNGDAVSYWEAEQNGEDRVVWRKLKLYTHCWDGEEQRMVETMEPIALEWHTSGLQAWFLILLSSHGKGRKPCIFCEEFEVNLDAPVHLNISYWCDIWWGSLSVGLMNLTNTLPRTLSLCNYCIHHVIWWLCIYTVWSCALSWVELMNPWTINIEGKWKTPCPAYWESIWITVEPLQ